MNVMTYQFFKFLDKPSTPSPNYNAFTKDYSSSDQQLNLLVVAGTFYDKGFAIGYHFSEGIIYSIHRIFRFSEKIGMGKNHIKLSRCELEKLAVEIHKNVPLHHLEELKGIIDGCQKAGHPIDPVEFFTAISYFEINEQFCCSMFTMNPPCSLQDTIHVSNSEYPYKLNLESHPLLLIHYPLDKNGKKAGLTYFSSGVVGIIGSLNGINEKSVTISQIRATFLKGSLSMKGIPYPYLINDILLNCQNAKESVEYLKDQAKTNPKFYLFSDNLKKTDSLQLVFSTPEYTLNYTDNEMIDSDLISEKEFGFYAPLKNVIYWYDMVSQFVNGGPKVALDAILPKYGTFNCERALEVTKALGSRYLTLSALYNTTSYEAWFSYATPGCSADKKDYVYIDLKPYLKPTI